jgi:glucosylceramidase
VSRYARRFSLLLVLGGVLIGTYLVFFQSRTITSAGPTVQVTLTTSNGSSQLSPQASLTFGSNTGNSSTINVNEYQELQQMTGFGAAVTDSSAWLMDDNLSASQRTTLMQNLFSPTQGIGLSFVRIPMGASDFSRTGAYSYDDLPAGQTDPTLTKFSISHDLASIIPILQQAHSLNPNLTFMANPWSPPAWMKTNGSMLGVNSNGVTGTLNTADYGPLARYFVKFIQAYQAQGIPISAITSQNEPEYVPTNYPGMSWSASGENSFLKNNLSPALANAGLSTQILGYDHNWNDTSFANTLLSDATTRRDLSAIAWHCYSGSPSAMTTIHNSYPTKGVDETECSTGAAVAPIDTIDLLMQSVQNYAQTVELWNLALDPNDGPHTGGCPDCLGVVTINEATGAVTYSNDYYLLGQFSKFAVPGAYHITSNNVGNVEDVAFKNPDGSKVVVAHNNGTASGTFQVLWGNQGFNYTLPAGATVTFKWSGTQQITLTGGGYAICAGGAATGSFQGDNYYAGGYSNTATVTDSISTSGVTNSAPQAVYQSQRYGNFSYVFPALQAGSSYTVRLHFAETYWTSSGQRVFNVALNGSTVLSNFDIIAATGVKDRALVKQFTTTADSHGHITIQFSSVTDYAEVNGIEISPPGGSF